MDQWQLITSQEYIAAAKEIRRIAPFGWLSSAEAEDIRTASQTIEAAIAGLKARALQIKADKAEVK